MKATPQRSLLLALICLGPRVGWAHDADVIFATIEANNEGLVETVTLTAESLALLAPVDLDRDATLTQRELDLGASAIEAGVWAQLPLAADGRACPLSRPTAVVHEGYVQLSAVFHCGPGALRQEARVLSVLPPNYRVVLGTQFERSHQFAQGDRQTLTLARPSARGGWSHPRFVEGFVDGVGRALTGGAAVAVGWVWLAAPTFAMTSVAMGVGLLTSAIGAREPWPTVAIALSLCVAVAVDRRRWSVAAPVLLGVGVGLRAGGGGVSTTLGLIGGSAAVFVALGFIALPLGRIVRRRPTVWRWFRVGAGVGALALLGFLLVDSLGP